MRQHNVVLSILLALLIASSALAADLVAQKSTKVYHKASCVMIKDACPCDIVKFTTAKDAEKAGYKPCDKCITNNDAKEHAAVANETKVADRGMSDICPNRRGCCSHHGGVVAKGAERCAAMGS